MSESARNERAALLTRAADLEAQRQTAVQRQDWPRIAATERELSRLWRQYRDLEARLGRAA